MISNVPKPPEGGAMLVNAAGSNGPQLLWFAAIDPGSVTWQHTGRAIVTACAVAAQPLPSVT